MLFKNLFNVKVEVFSSPEAVTEQAAQRCEQVDQYLSFPG